MTVTYAGFWKRFAAVIIDNIIILVVVLSVIIFIGFVLDPEAFSAFSTFLEQDEDDGVLSVVCVLIYWIYSAAMESSPLQATFGKMALRIKVTDVNGACVGFAVASGRYFGKLIPFRRCDCAIHGEEAGTARHDG